MSVRLEERKDEDLDERDRLSSGGEPGGLISIEVIPMFVRQGCDERATEVGDVRRCCN